MYLEFISFIPWKYDKGQINNSIKLKLDDVPFEETIY